MKDATQDKDVCELFIEGAHHRNLSVICIMQNLFNKGAENRTMSLNSQYMVLFKNPRDQQQIGILAKQMYPGNSKKLLEAYRKAVELPYGALIIDLKQTTPDSRRFQTDIFKNYKRLDTQPYPHFTPDSLSVQTSPEDSSDIIEKPKLLIGNQSVNMTQANRYQHSNMDYYPSYDNTTPVLDMKKMFVVPREPGERYPSCSDCGTMFATSYDLQRHTKNGCPMDEDKEEDHDQDESDMDNDDYGEDDDNGYNFLVNEVWDEHNAQYQNKVDRLMEEDENLSKEEAKQEASGLMLSKDKSLFMKKYKTLLVHMFDLNQSKLHRDIRKEISELVENKSLDLETASTRVIKQHKADFDALFEEYENNDDEEDDESSESEADD